MFRVLWSDDAGNDYCADFECIGDACSWAGLVGGPADDIFIEAMVDGEWQRLEINEDGAVILPTALPLKA